MTQPDNLVLQYLRRIDSKVDRLSDDLQDGKVRLTGVDESLAGVQRRIGRLESRVDRIERRPDFVDLPH